LLLVLVVLALVVRSRVPPPGEAAAATRHKLSGVWVERAAGRGCLRQLRAHVTEAAIFAVPAIPGGEELADGPLLVELLVQDGATGGVAPAPVFRDPDVLETVRIRPVHRSGAKNVLVARPHHLEGIRRGLRLGECHPAQWPRPVEHYTFDRAVQAESVA